jgi:hypothetical protein
LSSSILERRPFYKPEFITSATGLLSSRSIDLSISISSAYLSESPSVGALSKGKFLIAGIFR